MSEHQRLPVVEIMLKIGRLAEETAAWQRAGVIVDGGQAGIEPAAVVRVFPLPVQRRAVVEHPRDRRRDERPLDEAEIAETVVVLIGGVDAIQQRLARVDRAGGVDRVTLEVVASELDARLVHRRVERLLRDQIDHARGLAAAVEHRGGPLEHFDPLHIGKIARRRRRIEETVLSIVAGLNFEAAEEEGVGILLVARLDRAADVAQQLVDLQCLLILPQLLGNHVDRAWKVEIRHVHQRAGGRRVGVVSFDLRAAEDAALKDRPAATGASALAVADGRRGRSRLLADHFGLGQPRQLLALCRLPVLRRRRIGRLSQALGTDGQNSRQQQRDSPIPNH